MGGKMIWFVLLTYGALVVVAFWVANSENTKAKKAYDLAQNSLKQAEALDAGIRELKTLLEKDAAASDASYKAIVDAQLKNDARLDKFKEKLEWLEMKVHNLPKAQPPLPAKIVLAQDKPIQFTVITRKGPPAQLRKDKATVDPKVNEALMKNIKKKVNELSQ